ncbi:hypothetical protein ACQR3P_28970 [Rhodococcus sp. IEGM1300]
MLELEKLQDKINKEIEVTEKRIERRNGPCFHDETAKLHELNGRIYAYQKVLMMIDESNER